MSDRDTIVQCMREHLGGAYCSPMRERDGCFDCSGLVSVCLRRVGVDISQGSAEQWRRTRSKWIPVSEAKPGDLAFWGPSNNASHVGVVVSPGRVISAMNETDKVKETNLFGNMGAPLLGVTSILPGSSAPAPQTTPSSSSEASADPKARRRYRRRIRRDL